MYILQILINSGRFQPFHKNLIFENSRHTNSRPWVLFSSQYVLNNLAEFFCFTSLLSYHFWLFLAYHECVENYLIHEFFGFSTNDWTVENFLCNDFSCRRQCNWSFWNYNTLFYLNKKYWRFVLPGDGQLWPLWSLWGGDGERESARDSRGSTGLRDREPAGSDAPPPGGLEGRDPPPPPPWPPPGLDRGDRDDVGEKFPPVEPPPSDLLPALTASLAEEICGPEPGALCADAGEENPDDFPTAPFFDANVSDDNFNALLTLSNAAVW